MRYVTCDGNLPMDGSMTVSNYYAHLERWHSKLCFPFDGGMYSSSPRGHHQHQHHDNVTVMEAHFNPLPPFSSSGVHVTSSRLETLFKTFMFEATLVNTCATPRPSTSKKRCHRFIATSSKCKLSKRARLISVTTTENRTP